MRRDLSRRHCLSLGLFGGFGLIAACGGDDSTTTQAGSGGAGTSGSGGSTGGSGAGGSGTGGSGGSGTAGSGGSSTGGSGGSSTGGSGGSSTGGSGGSGTAGSGGSGTAGSGGSGGSTGGASGNAGSSGKGGSSGGASDGGASCGMNITALISLNHTTPHVLTIPAADVMAGVEKTYNSRGQSTHDHFVLITATDFTTLKAGGTIIKKSCNSGDHEYVISCGSPSRQPAAPTCSDECGAMTGMVCPP